MGGGADGGGGDGGGGEGDGGGGDGGDGGGSGGGKYSRGPQSSQSVPRLHWAPMAPTWPSWQRPLPTYCEPPFSKVLRQVLSQSIGGGGEDGADAATVAPTLSSTQKAARHLNRRMPLVRVPLVLGSAAFCCRDLCPSEWPLALGVRPSIVWMV